MEGWGGARWRGPGISSPDSINRALEGYVAFREVWLVRQYERKSSAEHGPDPGTVIAGGWLLSRVSLYCMLPNDVLSCDSTDPRAVRVRQTPPLVT